MVGSYSEELLDAVGMGGIEAFVNVLQKHGISIEEAAELSVDDGYAPNTSLLQNAAAFGNLEVVDLLCQHGANVNKRDMQNLTPLELAIRSLPYHVTVKDILQMVKTLLKHGAALESCAALYDAVTMGNPDLVRLLCNNGVEINTADKQYQDCVAGDVNSQDQDTPLHFAARMLNPEVIQALCEFGADVNKDNALGDLPLQLATRTMSSGSDPTRKSQVLKLLCEFGSDINKANQAGETPTSLAAKHSVIQQIFDAYQVVHPNQGCVTPLHTAVHTGNALMVREICNVHGTDVNTEDDNGRTPLFSAAQKGRTNIVEILCAHGADTNKAPRWKSTPLHCAALVGCKEAVKTLCEHGANVNALNVFGETALNFAAQGGYAEVIRTLCQHGADFDAPSKGTIPLSVFKYHQMDAATEMLKYWSPKQVDGDGYSALHYACYSPDMQASHRELVRLLLAHPESDCDIENPWDVTPLQDVFCMVDVAGVGKLSELSEIAQMLIKAGCSMGENCTCPFTLLRFKIAELLRYGQCNQEIDSLCDCFKLLLSAGISLTEEDFHRLTRANPSLVQLLADRGVQEQVLYACSKPLSLKRLCKLTIRQTARRPLTAHMPRSGLPEGLQKYVLLEEPD